MTNRILIPVDFTKYSLKAIEYALLLQPKTNFGIDLLHVFTDHSNIYQNALKNPELIDPRVGEAKRSMQQLTDELLAKYPDLQLNTYFGEGNLFDQVQRACNHSDYDAIVMGTKGASGIDALLIGSNMYDTFLNTHVPVLAVPYIDEKLKFNKIGLLCNFKEAEINVLQQAMKVYGNDFELVLIHINASTIALKEVEQKFEKFIDTITSQTGLDNISFIVKTQSFTYSENISSLIDTIIDEEQLDSLLVTKSKKGFFRKIIDEDIVKAMAYKIKIPKFFGKSI